MAYFAVLLAALAFASGWISRAAALQPNSVRAMSATAASTLLAVLPYLLAYWLLARLIERRKLDELAWRKSPQLLWGLLAAVLLFGVVALELWAAGVYAITSLGDAPLWTLFLLTAIGPAITEEVVSRGVLFRLTEEGLGTWMALAVSALFFGFAHSFNPGATLWTSVAISIEAGLLFGLLYHVTRSLWWCMGLHAGWNFVQGAVLGIPVSGIPVDGLAESTLQGPDWLDGGGFGAEASVLTVMTCCIASLLLLRMTLRGRSVVPPFWKRFAGEPSGAACAGSVNSFTQWTNAVPIAKRNDDP
ncbi:MAG: CPBP family intramembrane glutamic endopeptidase [Pseudoxanthomonas sp.]